VLVHFILEVVIIALMIIHLTVSDAFLTVDGTAVGAVHNKIIFFQILATAHAAVKTRFDRSQKLSIIDCHTFLTFLIKYAFCFASSDVLHRVDVPCTTCITIAHRLIIIFLLARNQMLTTRRTHLLRELLVRIL
jgi:hypothetical protein